MSEPDRSKFVLALVAIIAATGLVCLGRMGGEAWVSTVTWVVAAYMLGQPAAVFAAGWATQAVAKASERRT